MAGNNTAGHRWRSFSRIWGAPHAGYSRFSRMMVASVGIGSRFACR